MIDMLKFWLGFKSKQFKTKGKVKEITLPNWRIAYTDGKGNFLGWKE